MPFYDTNYIDSWKICKSVTIKKYFKLIDIFRKILYLSNNKAFEESIHLNGNIDECFVGVFDCSKSRITPEQYIFLMDDLIYRANVELSKNRKFDNYKFDIYGSWTIGKIIILEKK